MAELTRRAFITSASAGVAAASVLAAAPALAAPATPTAALTGGGPGDLPASALSEPLLVQVIDARTGELGVMIGTREITYHDPELVARLLKAAT